MKQRAAQILQYINAEDKTNAWWQFHQEGLDTTLYFRDDDFSYNHNDIEDLPEHLAIWPTEEERKDLPQPDRMLENIDEVIYIYFV